MPDLHARVKLHFECTSLFVFLLIFGFLAFVLIFVCSALIITRKMSGLVEGVSYVRCAHVIRLTLVCLLGLLCLSQSPIVGWVIHQVWTRPLHHSQQRVQVQVADCFVNVRAEDSPARGSAKMSQSQ